MVRRRFALVAAFLLTGGPSIAFAQPVPVSASASPISCAPAVSATPSDITAVFAYDLASPEILHFISALAAVPPKERKSVFDAAVAAASTTDPDGTASDSAACPTLDEIYGAARVSFLVVNQWQLKEFGDAKRFGAFSAAVATVISALAAPSRFTPEQRRDALRPFVDVLATSAVPSPSPSGVCAQPRTPARTRAVVQPAYPPSAISGRTEGSVAMKVLLAETGDVRYVRLVRDTLGRGYGADDVIKASIYAAAATTYWPETKDCRPAPGAYVFEADFRHT